MEVAPYLLFPGNCKEAFEFYERALGGKLEMMTYGQSPESDKMPAALQNQVIHARLAAGASVPVKAASEAGTIQQAAGILGCSRHQRTGRHRAGFQRAFAGRAGTHALAADFLVG